MTSIRDTISGAVYRGILKPVFFMQDPEKVHDKMVNVGKILGKSALGKSLVSTMFGYKDPVLEQEILGVKFANPIGLSAGFDKNGELTDIIPSVGFGFAEIGSVTGEKCLGNVKPRLWRIPELKSIKVNYGLKNDGCITIAERISKRGGSSMPIGVSVAATNCAENMDLKLAVKDFEKAFITMEPVADYLTLNVSCPNAVGGQTFLSPHKLDYLLDIIDEVPTQKPIFIKLSPDLSTVQIDDILEIVKKHRVHGIICSNLTKKYGGKGGLSGKVVENDSEELLSYLYKKVGNSLVLIASGGVFTAEDAYRKIRLGASLIQIITGMIYQGPQVIGEINRGLAKLLKRDGFESISKAVGANLV